MQINFKEPWFEEVTWEIMSVWKSLAKINTISLLKIICYSCRSNALQSKLSMNFTHELIGKCHLFLEKKGALIVREQASWGSLLLIGCFSVEFNKAQTTRKRIGSDRHRAVSVIYSKRGESIMQKHFLGRERKHCCVKWESFEGFQVFIFGHSAVD